MEKNCGCSPPDVYFHPGVHRLPTSASPAESAGDGMVKASQVQHVLYCCFAGR